MRNGIVWMYLPANSILGMLNLHTSRVLHSLMAWCVLLTLSSASWYTTARIIKVCLDLKFKLAGWHGFCCRYSTVDDRV